MTWLSYECYVTVTRLPQAFYDAALEPFNNVFGRHFKTAKAEASAPAALAIVSLVDVAFGSVFVGYTLAGVEGVLAFAAIVATAKMCRK